MDHRMILFGLHQLSGIGWKRISRLVEHFPDLQMLLDASAGELMRIGLPAEAAEAIAQKLKEDHILSFWERYIGRGIQIMTVFDPDYPPLLRELPQPPWVLYGIGNLAVLNEALVAMVGTRVPTAYGVRVTEQLAGDLARCGIGIVSGLARGIDAAAHRGALRQNGVTVAVMGTAIDQIYPPEHKPLWEQIAECGAVISEYPIGTRPHPGLFPQRNRIVAGLTLGTVVVEAAAKSGALITAYLAVEASRDVFAVPGPVTSPKSAGCHSLIRQGAKLVVSAHDILEEYAHMIRLEHPAPKRSSVSADLTEQERKIRELISHEPVTIDQLAVRSGYPFGLLHSILLSLQLKKQIVQLPGSEYIST
jgi:DNA processing protein